MKEAICDIRDDRLLELIRRRNEDPDAADEAWQELYRRHVRYVYWRVSRTTGFVGRGLVPEDIVNQTFEEVYLRAADGFKAGEYVTDEHARRHIRAWLGQIACYEVLKAIQSRAHESLIVRDPELLDTRVDGAHASIPVSTGQQRSGDDAATVAAAVLSTDELEIVWLKMQYYDPNTSESRIPGDELEAVCGRQGISKEALRKRYERALNKVQEAMVTRTAASQTYTRRT